MAAVVERRGAVGRRALVIVVVVVVVEVWMDGQHRA